MYLCILIFFIEVFIFPTLSSLYNKELKVKIPRGVTPSPSLNFFPIPLKPIKHLKTLLLYIKSALYLSLRLQIILIVMINFDKYFQVIIIAENRIEINDLRNILSLEFNVEVKLTNTLSNFDFTSTTKKNIFIYIENDISDQWNKLTDKVKNNSFLFMISSKKKTLNYFAHLGIPLKVNDLIIKIYNLLKTEANKSQEKLINHYIYSYQSSTITDKNSERVIFLTEMENKFMHFLSKNKKAVEKKKILSEVWGHNYELDTHTLESLVYRLRRKLELDPQNPTIIISKKNKYYLNS